MTKININRLTYRSIALEITRKCNLQCTHCLRGDAQDVDIKPETIDAFLDHTQAIYTLLITGGEPTINIEGMRYFLEAAKKRNVLISALQVVTNGVIRNDEVKKLFEDFATYISRFLLDDVPIVNRLMIVISTDSFHETNSTEAYNWYCENLSHIATISKSAIGDFPIALGNAQTLPYAMKAGHRGNTRIEYKTNDHEPICPESEYVPLFHPNQVIIMCQISITAHGDMLSDYRLEYDNEDNDKKYYIGNVFVDTAQEIIDNIDKFNFGKPYCIENEHKSKQRNTFSDLLDMSIQYFDIKNMLFSHPNPEEFIAKYYVRHMRNIGTCNLILEMNEGPIDLSILGIDIENNREESIKTMVDLCYEYNGNFTTYSSIPERIKENIIKEIDDKVINPEKYDKKQDALLDRAHKIHAEEAVHQYNAWTDNGLLSDSDKEMWDLLYQIYSLSVSLYENTIDLHNNKPDDSYYSKLVDERKEIMQKDFNKLISFIKNHSESKSLLEAAVANLKAK